MTREGHSGKNLSREEIDKINLEPKYDTPLLEGYKTCVPLEQSLLEITQTLGNCDCVCVSALNKMCLTIQGYKEIKNIDVKTPDGYEWFCGLYFEQGDTKTAVLIPKGYYPNPEKKENFILDRPVWVYSNKVVEDNLSQEVVDAIKDKSYNFCNRKNLG